MIKCRKGHKIDCNCTVCKAIRGETKDQNNPRGFLGKTHNQKSRNLIAKASMERWNNSKYKNRVSKSISKGRKGIKFTKEHKANLKKNHAHSWTGKHHTKKTRKILSQKLMGHKSHQMKTNIVKHHKYLKENSSETIKVTRNKHRLIHSKAYHYIYETKGKRGINRYLKWIDKKLKGGIK